MFRNYTYKLLEETLISERKKEKITQSLPAASSPILHETDKLNPDLLNYINAQRTQR